MKRETVSTILLICLAVGALWATFLILEPFIRPILTSVVLAIAFYPLFVRLRRFFTADSRAALVTVLLMTVAVLVPLMVIGAILARELYSLVETVAKRSQESGGFALLWESWLDRVVALAAPVVHISADDAKVHLADALQKVRLILLSGAGGKIGNVFAVLIETVVVLVLVYFLLRDGRTILERFTRFQLLERGRRERILSSISSTIQASMYGTLTAAVAQAVLMGAALAVLSVPDAVLWGAVTLFASLVPLVGTSLVWIPAALYLFVTAGWMKALAIAAWGVVVVGGVDNFARPFLMKGKVELHPLVLLFALVGGTRVFGLLGLFAGPVILGVTFALLDMLEFDLQNAGFLDEHPADDAARAGRGEDLRLSPGRHAPG